MANQYTSQGLDHEMKLRLNEHTFRATQAYAANNQTTPAQLVRDIIMAILEPTMRDSNFFGEQIDD